METSQKLEIAKTACRWTSQLGSSAIIHGVVRNNTEAETVAQKVQLFAGSLCLAGIVGKQVAAYSDELFDETADNITKLRDWFQKRNAEKQQA